MRHTNDFDSDEDFERQDLPSFLNHAREQPQRAGGKPEYSRKKFPKRGAAPTSCACLNASRSCRARSIRAIASRVAPSSAPRASSAVTRPGSKSSASLNASASAASCTDPAPSQRARPRKYATPWPMAPASCTRSTSAFATRLHEHID